VKAQPNWWNDFFEGPAVALWLQAIGPEPSGREAGFEVDHAEPYTRDSHLVTFGATAA
jgi:hypothetical protein